MPKLIKHTIPSKFTQEPFGTIWSVQGNEKTNLAYIQVSKDFDNPHWLTMGDFLEVALGSELENEKFIEDCLKKF